MLDKEALLTTRQAAEHLAAAGVTQDVVRQWAHRGLLVVAERAKNGRPLYRLGDLLEVERRTRSGVLAS